MRKILALLGSLAIALVACAALSIARADTQSDKNLIDIGKLQVSKSTAAINTGSLTWTNYQALATITADAATACSNFRVCVNLDTTTTGWATNGGSATITMGIARKVDGTHWVVAKNLETTALAGSSSTGYMHEFNVGEVGPGEQVALYAKVSSATGLAITNFDVILYYKSPIRVTVATSS
jgi:hypothetical protein